MTIVYCRCNGGDYYRAELGACPLDGWTSSDAAALSSVVQALKIEHRPLSIQALAKAGISPSTLERILIIEFGSERSVFEAMTPRGYLLGGNWVLLKDASLSLL